MPISPEAQALIQLVASKNRDNVQLALTLQNGLQSADFEHFISLCAYFNDGQDLRQIAARPLFKRPDLSEKVLYLIGYKHPLEALGEQLQVFQNYSGLKIIRTETSFFHRSNFLEAGFQRLKNLTLEENTFCVFPLSVCSLKGLQSLHIRRNYIHHIPETIANLSQLHDLDLSENWISALPADFAKLQQLQTLRLSGNHFEQFPPQIGEISRLKRLFLEKNGLPMCLEMPYKRLKEEREGARRLIYSDSAFFVQLLDKKALRTGNIIQYAEILNIRGEFSSFIKGKRKFAPAYLPDSFENLQNLEVLDISHNNFYELPPILSKLPNLQQLYIGSNPCTDTAEKQAFMQKTLPNCELIF